MNEISNGAWSETDAANNAATPNGWPEGQPPSSVNDCARMMMGAVKLGLTFVSASPAGYEPNQLIVKSATREAQRIGGPAPAVTAAAKGGRYTLRSSPSVRLTSS